MSILDLEVITHNPLVVWVKITLPIRDFKSITEPTYGMFHLFSVTHIC